VLSVLLAALCHDLEHPGTTNAFQVNTGSALALRYNDASVLENHHAATGFALLERAALLRGLSAAEYRACRKAMLAAILATDMSAHKELLARVSSRVDAAEAEAEAAAAAAREAAAAAQAEAAEEEECGAHAPLRTSSAAAVALRLDRRRSLNFAALREDNAAAATLAAAGGSPRVGPGAGAGAGAPAPAGCLGFRRDSPEDRELLVCFLLHCADLCNRACHGIARARVRRGCAGL
jgi:hypothetical protein